MVQPIAMKAAVLETQRAPFCIAPIPRAQPAPHMAAPAAWGNWL